MHKDLKIWRFLPVLFAGLTLCCSRLGEVDQISPLKLFPPPDVCSYPVNSSIKKLHLLGGGNWQRVLTGNDARSLEFDCGSNSNVMQLYGGAEDFVTIEYTVTGTESGASMILIDYSASGPRQFANEPTLRSVYSHFVEEMIGQALNQPPPELLRKKILNLNSYSETGSESYEAFDVGDGFINLSRVRNANNSTILVKSQIFADTASKLR